MKNKNLMFTVFLISAVLAMSLVSASWFSDLFNPTGNALKEKQAVTGTDFIFDNANSKTGIIKFTTSEGKITEVEEDAIVKTNKGDFKVEITKPFIGPARVKFTPSTETSNVDLTPETFPTEKSEELTFTKEKFSIEAIEEKNYIFANGKFYSEQFFEEQKKNWGEYVNGEYVPSEYEKEQSNKLKNYINTHPQIDLTDKILYLPPKGEEADIIIIPESSVSGLQTATRGTSLQVGDTVDIKFPDDPVESKIFKKIFGCGTYVIPASGRVFHDGGWFRDDVEIHGWLG